MKRRVAAVAIASLLAAAPLGCNGKPSPFKRAPAEAGLMADAGAKKVAVKKRQGAPTKLDVVPVKTEEKPEVRPVEPSPFVPKDEKAKGEEDAAFEEMLKGLKGAEIPEGSAFDYDYEVLDLPPKDNLKKRPRIH